MTDDEKAFEVLIANCFGQELMIWGDARTGVTTHRMFIDHFQFTLWRPSRDTIEGRNGWYGDKDTHISLEIAKISVLDRLWGASKYGLYITGSEPFFRREPGREVPWSRNLDPKQNEYLESMDGSLFKNPYWGGRSPVP